MPRIRRYRLFLICAILMTVGLVRLSRNRQWEIESAQMLRGAWEGFREETYDHFEGLPSSKDTKKPLVEAEKLTHPPVPEENTFVQGDALPSKTSLVPTPTSSIPASVLDGIIPDRTLAPPATVSVEENNAVHLEGAGRVEAVTFIPTQSLIHWQKQVEHFPVPPDSIIQLPTGKPISMPKIQYTFSDETPSGRLKREERLGKVREEFKRAWDGYKTFAWMHDELQPLSGGYRDPFAGWAATLVDSLDTLYIMGLEEEFEEAVKAVSTIDFTIAKRADIQVFEVTIRYLGGLLAAYDVSGGTKKVLLDKAVELAEVLMGAFDTPNRMPILFYMWKPTFASQPHRASTRSSLAELGTLSMEFTHLAQLTKEPKYYDAVARITNALEEWQNRGTTGLTGVFPANVDASGCNRSAIVIKNVLPSGTPTPLDPSSKDGEGYKAPAPKNVKEPLPLKGKGAKERPDIELSVMPGEPSRAHLETVQRAIHEIGNNVGKISKRAESITDASGSALTPVGTSNANESRPASSIRSLSKLPDDGIWISEKALGGWDCVAQGLESTNFGHDLFGMGGGQDSAYEYFPKQYLLLGGLEEKYRTLYLKTMDAIREHMLYRPMVPNDRDILFSGKIIKNGAGGQVTFVAEVTHLTCFLGGMVGMGAKLFNLKLDLEIAKKLSDGCVWAYESMNTGVMPEMAEVLPCASVTNCPWNETLWKKSLDPMAGQREQQIKDYESKMARLKAQEDQERLAAQSKLAAEENEGNSASEVSWSDLPDNRHAANIDVDSKSPVSTNQEESGSKSTVAETLLESKTLEKRQLGKERPETTISEMLPLSDTDERLQRKLNDTEIELQGTASGREMENPSAYVPKIPTPNGGKMDLKRPPTHEEYVEAKIKREGLAPGFTKINRDNYFLRPEAIESVWYMYRITGDPVWQEKGWIMFEKIINVTSTTYGHSAIRGVSGAYPLQQIDEMESFWLAETLKYFYLLYSTPDIISLDDWVLNTEAHPFKRPK